MDVAQQTDYSQEPKFTEAMAKGVYYGPIYFNARGTYMTLSVGGTVRDAGVSIAEVNLALIQELVRSTKVGEHGVGYVVDAVGRVIAHPDVSMVQRDFSSLAHVLAARAAAAGAVTGAAQVARDIDGREVLATYAPITKSRLGWLVLVELPVDPGRLPGTGRSPTPADWSSSCD